MHVEGFVAEGDIVGHRVKARWTFVLTAGETLADLPAVVLRRKARDFEFPPADGDPTDPFLVYATEAFPPAGTTAVEIELGGEHGPDGGQVRTTAVSAATTGAQPFEVLRRTRAVTTRPDGTVAAVTDTVLDVGAGRDGLSPRTTCYYELTVPGDPQFRATAVATPTATHGTSRNLYEQLPAVFRRHDVTVPPPRPTGQVPEAVAVNGQLRRFLDVVGAAADHIRSRADGLRDVHDVDLADHRLLPHLANGIGWELNTAQPIPFQRHEIRYAPHLYGLTGTVPGCLAWFKRLSGWDADLHEFWRNVFLTNDLGNPDDPADRGSRTVDTTDPDVIATIGRPGDTVDYTYDTAVGPDHRYAHNVVGFFVTPAPDETIEDIARKRGRVLASVDRFLPCNLRAVVVVDVPTELASSESSLALTTATEEGG